MSILVGRTAPDFTAAAVLANGEITSQFHFAEVIKNKYAVLFFYPLDFNIINNVCTYKFPMETNTFLNH